MPSLSELLDSKKTVFIGSSAENDIVVDEATVSPMHCQVSKVQTGVYRIVDLESGSGTFLNGQKVTKAVAGDEDELRVGSRSFTFKSKAQNASPQTGYGFYQNSTASADMKNKITVYFLAAPEDEATCESVYRHLSTVRFSSPLPVEIIGDFKMTGGEDIAAYRQKLAGADIVLAFVSVDFLNNNDCYERLKTVIDNHNNRKAILLPILVRNCLWKNTPFANLPLLPKNQQPLNNKQYWNSEDDALTNVVNDIYQSITTLTKNSTPQAPLSVAQTPTLNTNWRGQYLWRNFWKRTLAYLLDVLIIVVPLIIVLYLVLGENFVAESGSHALLLGLLNTGLLVLVYSYFDSSKWKGTPGKHIMGLEITDEEGQPISFDKALVRNAIKFVLFGVVGGLDSSGVVSLLFIVAQVVCYAASKKFIHDYLSHTVIGERLKAETLSTNAQATSPAVNAVRPARKSMATAIVIIIAAVCLVSFAVLKLTSTGDPYSPQPLVSNVSSTNDVPEPAAETKPTEEKTTATQETAPEVAELTEEVKAGLFTAIKYGDQTEIEAFQRLDAGILSRAFRGEKLRESQTELQHYIEQGLYQVSELEGQQFHDFKLSADGQKAEVTVTETWSTVIYLATTNECKGRVPSHDVSQTVYLEKIDGVWMIYNIIFDNAQQPSAVPCN